MHNRRIAAPEAAQAVTRDPRVRDQTVKPTGGRAVKRPMPSQGQRERRPKRWRELG